VVRRNFPSVSSYCYPTNIGGISILRNFIFRFSVTAWQAGRWCFGLRQLAPELHLQYNFIAMHTGATPVSFYMLLLVTALLLGLSACKEETPMPAPARTYRMGFLNSAPRFDNYDLFIRSLNIWTTRADAAIISLEVPWDSLLAGKSPEYYVLTTQKGLADYYRSLDFKLWVYIDPGNSLDRAVDAATLTQAGRSMTEPEIQRLYIEFVISMDSILKPDHLGLVLETNLMRTASPAPLYNAIRTAANQAAADLRTRGSTTKLSVSVQVDHAWGLITNTPYAGVDQDFVDFPFIQELGLSSYPYFVFDNPSQIPDNFYTRVVAGRNLPVFVSESGWTSATVTTPNESFISSPAIQKAYIERHSALLASVNATAYFQLPFTDIDTTDLPDIVPETIGYFAYLGLVDAQFVPKPALAAWDELYSLPLE
jgi:hypothetical protein